MHFPSVSIIVPARNEECHIAEALSSLCTLQYGPLEIVVVDDNSDDRTAHIVERFISTYAGPSQLRLLTVSEEPPKGWVGKTFATDFAIKESTGELIVVCDVDVRHTPESLREIVRVFLRHRLDILSQLPHFDVRSPLEYPLLYQTFLLYRASQLAARLGSRQSFGMGTYLLFTRDFYLLSGGWSMHRSYPESLSLINYCLKGGGHFAFLGDSGAISARMYVGAAETFRGLVRNSNFALLQPLPLFFTVAWYSLFIEALLLAAAGSILAVILILIMVGMFMAHVLHSRYPPRLALSAGLLSPLMPFYFLIVAGAALLRQLFGIPLTWRGRRMRPQ